METKVLMDVEEYLRTGFEPDCDYLDGEVVERNLGELPHGLIQVKLVQALTAVAAGLNLIVVSEIRIQIHPRRYRVADLAVWRKGNIGTRIPTVPPFLAIEILSPDDRMVRVLPRIQDYLSIGVEWVWLIDPEEKSAICFSQQQPAGTICDVLRTEEPHIGIPLSDILPE